METETMHFTRDNVLWHATYEHKAERGKVSWFKTPGSEKNIREQKKRPKIRA